MQQIYFNDLDDDVKDDIVQELISEIGIDEDKVDGFIAMLEEMNPPVDVEEDINKYDVNGDDDNDVYTADLDDDGEDDAAIVAADSDKEEEAAVDRSIDELGLDDDDLTSTGKTKDELDEDNTLSDEKQKKKYDGNLITEEGEKPKWWQIGARDTDARLAEKDKKDKKFPLSDETQKNIVATLSDLL